MKQLRLFTGLALRPDVLARFADLLAELRPLANASWSPAENLHITTKFIGAWPEDRLEELKSALEKAPRQSVFPVSISGFAFFPNPKHPKTLFAEVHAGPRLAQLAHSLDEACATLGCARETRPYAPHLTLARLKHDNIGQLVKHLTDMRNTDFGAFDAAEFHLYLSKPGPSGSIYTQLATWRLPC